MLRVDTDMAQGPGQTLTGVRVELLSGDETEPRPNHTLRVDLAVPASDDLLLPADLLGMQPRDGDPARPVTVRVTALHGGDALFTTSARFSFAPHRATLLEVFLANRCLQASCAPGTACGRGGACEPIDRGALPDFTPFRPPDEIPPPRPIAPLSSSIVSSRRPTLRWAASSRADGARVELCRDRDCTQPLATLDAPGASAARPLDDLPPGPVFWRLRGWRGDRVGASAGPAWQFVVGAGASGADAHWGSVLDLNGDGLADAVAAAPFAEPARVYVYHGAAAGAGAGERGGLVSAEMFEGHTREGFGLALGRGGDLDGDGYGDFAIGAPRQVDTALGRVEVYHGGPGALRHAATIQGFDPPFFNDDGTGGVFGWSLTMSEDINLDGYGDLIVGARFNARAYVYLGGPDGIAADRPSQIITAPGAAYPLPACTPSPSCQLLASFGGNVASVGDLNGDGYHDVIIGVPYAGSDAAAAVPVGFSTAYVYLGGPAGLIDRGYRLENPGAAQNLREFTRSMMGAGDINGDGLADVVIGAGQHDDALTGAFVFYGSAVAGTLLSPPVPLEGGQVGCFGREVAAAGDVNRDGFADVVVGEGGLAPWSSRTCPMHAYLFLGGPGSVARTPAATLTAPAPSADDFGMGLARVGDANGDGADDVLVGAPGRITQYTAGAGYLYFGGVGAGLDGSTVQTLARPDVTGAGFGAVFAR